MGLFQLVERFVLLAVSALGAYDQTEEGHTEIEGFLAELEAEGIDVPFWEPSEEAKDAAQDLKDERQSAVRHTFNAVSARALHRYVKGKR